MNGDTVEEIWRRRYIEISFGQIIATSHEGKSRLVKYSNLARLHRDYISIKYFLVGVSYISTTSPLFSRIFHHLRPTLNEKSDPCELWNN